MSVEKFEVKDKKGKIHKATIHDLVYCNGALRLSVSMWSDNILDETCQIRQGQSDWYPITKDLYYAIKEADGDIAKAYHDTTVGRQQSEEETRRQQEAEAQQRKEAETKAIDNIHQLKAKCASGEWSLADLQHIFHLVSNIPTTSLAASQEVDELVHAQNELINEVCKNPSLSEPLKIMYANAQLGMQQQILDNLEQLSSNQAQSNTILKQNQKSGNQKAAAGLLGGMVALNKLGDISDALGGDE